MTLSELVAVEVFKAERRSGGANVREGWMFNNGKNSDGRDWWVWLTCHPCAQGNVGYDCPDFEGNSLARDMLVRFMLESGYPYCVRCDGDTWTVAFGGRNRAVSKNQNEATTIAALRACGVSDDRIEQARKENA